MRSRIASLTLLACFGAGGCGPIAFSDAGAITIVADAPPPEPVEEIAQPEQIELREKVRFARDSARILIASHPVLDEAAATILDAPSIRQIRIEGHASADGNDAHNLELSAERAQAVRQYLIRKGVAEDLLTSEGFGETQPVADNDTPEGREANRRVELHIVEQDRAQGSGDASANP